MPEAVKLARLQEVISTYRAELSNSMAAEIGRTHLVSFHSCKLCVLFVRARSLQLLVGTNCSRPLGLNGILLAAAGNCT